MEEEVVAEMYDFILHDSAHTYTKQIFCTDQDIAFCPA